MQHINSQRCYHIISKWFLKYMKYWTRDSQVVTKKHQFYSTEHKNVQKTSNSLNTWRISTAYDWKKVKRSFGKSVIQYVEVIHFSTRGCWLWDRDKNMEIGSLRQPKIRSLLWWAQEWACHCNRHPRENSIRIVPFSKSQKLKITPVSGVFLPRLLLNKLGKSRDWKESGDLCQTRKLIRHAQEDTLYGEQKRKEQNPGGRNHPE